jgi:hypothetical protein
VSRRIDGAQLEAIAGTVRVDRKLTMRLKCALQLRGGRAAAISGLDQKVGAVVSDTIAADDPPGTRAIAWLQGAAWRRERHEDPVQHDPILKAKRHAFGKE